MNNFVKAAEALTALALGTGAVGQIYKNPSREAPASGTAHIQGIVSSEGACIPRSLDEVQALGVPEGQSGHVLENTGWIDENTGQTHPMQIEGYRVSVRKQPTGIIMNNGDEYFVEFYEYEPEGCFGPNPEKR